MAFVVCGALLMAPLAIFVVGGGSYLQTAHESLAYRYFFAYRMASAEDGLFWIPQGWVTAVLQRLVFGAEGIFVSPQGSLRLSMELFGILTTAVQTVLAVVLMGAVIRDRRLHWMEKAAVAMALLVPLYCTATAGPYYWLLPDYYHLNIVLLAAIVFLSFKSQRLAATSSWISGAIVLGAFAGVVIANKVSLAIPCLIPLIPVLLGSISWRRTIGFLLVCGVSAIIAFVASWVLVYAPRWTIMQGGVESWLQYVRAPGSDVQWSADLVRQSLAPYNYDAMALLYVALWLAVLVILGTSLGWRAESVRVSAALALLGIMTPLPLVVRLSGTTLFEVFLTLTAVTAVQLGLLRHSVDASPAIRRVATGTVVALLVVCCLQPVRTKPWRWVMERAKQSGDRAQLVWGLHDAMRASRRPVVFVTPDNDYRFFTVEEALLRGFSDFPSWLVSTGQSGIDRLYGAPLQFRVSGSPLEHPSRPYPTDAVLAWVDVVHPDYQLLPMQYPALAEATARPGVNCREALDPYDRYRRITVCTPPDTSFVGERNE
jgi:hypothetical protein